MGSQSSGHGWGHCLPCLLGPFGPCGRQWACQAGPPAPKRDHAGGVGKRERALRCQRVWGVRAGMDLAPPPPCGRAERQVVARPSPPSRHPCAPRAEGKPAPGSPGDVRPLLPGGAGGFPACGCMATTPPMGTRAEAGCGRRRAARFDRVAPARGANGWQSRGRHPTGVRLLRYSPLRPAPSRRAGRCGGQCVSPRGSAKHAAAHGLAVPRHPTADPAGYARSRACHPGGRSSNLETRSSITAVDSRSCHASELHTL